MCETKETDRAILKCSDGLLPSENDSRLDASCPPGAVVDELKRAVFAFLPHCTIVGGFKLLGI